MADPDKKKQELEEALVKKVLLFKNPYDVLNLPIESTTDDLQKRYKKLALRLHPDKCKHPKAMDAFDALKKAMQTLEDTEIRDSYRKVVITAREQVMRDWKALSRTPRSETDFKEFDHDVKKITQKILLEREASAKRAEKNIQANERREKEQELREKKIAKLEMEYEKDWEETRLNRVNSWRSFQQKVKTGTVKPKRKRPIDNPETKEEDETLDSQGNEKKPKETVELPNGVFLAPPPPSRSSAIPEKESPSPSPTVSPTSPTNTTPSHTIPTSPTEPSVPTGPTIPTASPPPPPSSSPSSPPTVPPPPAPYYGYPGYPSQQPSHHPHGYPPYPPQGYPSHGYSQYGYPSHNFYPPQAPPPGYPSQPSHGYPPPPGYPSQVSQAYPPGYPPSVPTVPTGPPPPPGVPVLGEKKKKKYNPTALKPPKLRTS